ncbi:MAG: carbamoyl-phosphate synthase small subunit [Actinobacteria bacterium]|nr:carbamoyl-phosphate synthase small subunit [Actinomycetota bacterium]
MTGQHNEGLREGALVLADGSVFEGELIGAPAEIASGEVVFNTALSGYQEIITDPSYAGQMVTFTYPHIGNYGINTVDAESKGAACRGVIVRDLARRHSNHRAELGLGEHLAALGTPGIAGVDTRRLTRILRDSGAVPGAFGSASEAELLEAARSERGTDGIDLVSTVTTDQPYSLGSEASRRIVALDFGVKTTILRCLTEFGSVEVLPASTSAAEVLARGADGVFLSNGPGDPGMLDHLVETVSGLIGQVPIFGICLGHQILGRALGAPTVKLPFGHHGGNHPVKDLLTGRIEITSQNHNFAVDADAFAGLGRPVRMTHVNLNDGVCEGLEVIGERCFSVQHHPEAGPGPHDSRHLFERFAEMMDGAR